MRVNNRQRVILVGVLQDLQRLAHVSLADLGGMSRAERGRIRFRVQRADAGIVPMNLAEWLDGTPTPSDRVLFHREYARLESMGLLERCNFHGGKRTSHLKLTAAGRALAQRLQDEESEQSVETHEASDIDWAHPDFLPIEIPLQDEEADDETR